MTDRSRSRLIWLLTGAVVLAAGLASRRYGNRLPDFIATYAGDTLWALLVYCGISALWPAYRGRHRLLAAAAFAYGVELSQLCKAPWLEAIRHTTLGGLVLGFDFVWSDLVCYTAGIAIGALFERFVLDRGPTVMAIDPGSQAL